MEQRANRLKGEMKLWDAREQRFSKLFSPSILNSRAFKKEKLQHLRKLDVRYSGVDDPDERLTRRLLKQERRALEKELYPNKLKRNFIRLTNSLGRLGRILAQPVPGTVNTKTLQRDVQRAGFDDLGKQIRREKTAGMESLPNQVSRKINDRESLEYRLNYGKDHKGNPQYMGQTVTLAGNGKPVSFRIGTNDQRLSDSQTYNLLSGRSVLVRGEWLVLDGNDKDASGNSRIKRIPEKHGADLERELRKLPLKENRFAITLNDLIASLKNGEKVPVSLKVNGQGHFLSTNGKGLELFDSKGKKVPLEEHYKSRNKKGSGDRLKQSTGQTTSKKMVEIPEEKVVRMKY